MSRVLELLERVGGAFGPSGREDAVRACIAEQIAPYVDDMTTDALGNLICHKKGIGQKLLLDAHMDTIGMVATFVDDKGFVRFAPVGGLFRGNLLHRRVRFENGTYGILSYEEKIALKDITMDHLFIDIGANSREMACEHVQPGDFAVFDGTYVAQNGTVCGPYLDNRIGCVTLMLLLEQLEQTAYDVYVVFSVQEEVGLRGAGAAAFGIDPDCAIVVDVTDTGDIPEVKTKMAVSMGAGPAIKRMDRAVICSPQIVRRLEEVAAHESIAVQHEILLAGGTNTAPLQRTRAGVLAGALSIPTRYLHSPTELCAERDVLDAVKLLKAFVEHPGLS